MSRFPTQQILWRRLDDRLEGSIAVFMFGPCSEGEEKKPTLVAAILAKPWEMSGGCFSLQRCQGTMAGYKCPTLRWCKLQLTWSKHQPPNCGIKHLASMQGAPWAQSPINGLLTREERRDPHCGLRRAAGGRFHPGSCSSQGNSGGDPRKIWGIPL